MSSKVEIVTVNTPLNSSSFQQQINHNFSVIEASLNKQLQRESQEDVNNEMEQELDMNSHRIINVAEPVNNSDAATKHYVDTTVKPELEANRVVVSDGNGDIVSSSITTTELNTLSGISGNIQEQINSKQDTISDLDEIRAGAAAGASALQAEDLNLSNCNDVDLTNPAEGDALIYNSTSQKWENREVRHTYRGVYDAAVTYVKGDIVAYESYFYIAKNTTTGNTPNNTTYWSEISNDGLVHYAEKTDNVEYPVGFTNYGISSNIYSGSMNFTTTSSPTINASTGALTATVLKTTTQNQNDASTNAATTAYVDTAKDGLQSQINNLSARGRFLALWDCSTGLAMSNPPESPYTYHAGDYFIVGAVASGGASNYKPTGSSYTTGVASSTVETEAVDVDDVYYYDGTNWKLQVNVQKTVSFVNIAGSPYDNTLLANALNAKADSSSLAAVATSGSYSDLLGTPTIPVVDQIYNASSANAQSGVAVASAVSGKQDTLVSGTSIKTVNSTSLLGSGDISIQPSYNSSTKTLEF